MVHKIIILQTLVEIWLRRIDEVVLILLLVVGDIGITAFLWIAGVLARIFDKFECAELPPYITLEQFKGDFWANNFCRSDNWKIIFK